MKASEVPTDGVIAVDSQGTVWVPCGGADGHESYWRYIEGSDGSMSPDQFRSLPTNYEPYLALDGAASSLVYHNLQAPKIFWATQKR